MAAPAKLTKVLRIGIIQDGKIVQERLIKAGETVTVGESEKSTFVFPPTALGQGSHPLFVAKGGGYELSFTEVMKGKISSSNGVVGLDKLRGGEEVTKEGDTWRLALTEQDRGKVTIDNVTVLFQFVPPPPPDAAKPLEAMDFRPKFFEDDDPIFFGFLGLWTALAAIMVVWVMTSEPRESSSLEEIPDRFTKLLLDKPEKKDLPEVEEKFDENAKSEDAPAKEEASKEEAPKKEPKTREEKVEDAQRKEQMKQDIMQKSLLLQMIGTRGANNSGATVEDLFGDGDNMGKIDLNGVGGVEIATADNQHLREGSGTTTGDADIGDLAKGDVGEAGVGSANVKIPTGSVDVGNAEVAEGDPAKVKDVVNKYRGQVKYCYEQQLKANPSLEGRVEVEFTVGNGRVMSASVFVNTTGDQALGDCILGKIKRWRFPAELETDVSYPFIFRPNN